MTNSHQSPYQSVLSVDTPRLESSLRRIGNGVPSAQSLGRGSFGLVIKSSYNGKPVAIKLIDLNDPVKLCSVDREANAIPLYHENIIHILKISKLGSKAVIIMERLESTNLQNLIVDYSISLHNSILISEDIIRALAYCHGNQIIHMDVKPQNVLVCLAEGAAKGYICKICDFGSSINISNSPKTPLVKCPSSGTIRYMSPNILLGQDGCPTDDIYSFGVTMWQMIARQNPYEMLDCNDLVAYNVVKLNMRPDSVNLQRKLSGGAFNMLSPKISPSRDLFSPKPMQMKNTRVEIRKCCSVSKLCQMHNFDVFRTPELQSGHLMPSSVKLINKTHMPILRNHKQRRSIAGSTVNICPKKLTFSPAIESCPNQMGMILEKSGLDSISFDMYRNIYRECWHSEAIKRPSPANIQLELYKLLKQ